MNELTKDLVFARWRYRLLSGILAEDDGSMPKGLEHCDQVALARYTALVAASIRRAALTSIDALMEMADDYAHAAAEDGQHLFLPETEKLRAKLREALEAERIVP